MVTPKKVKETEELVVVASEKDLDAVMSSIDKINPDATYLSDSPLSQVSDWLSTDCYALNAIMSGSVYKAVPVGRVTTFYGLPATGKTLILNKIIADGFKKGFKRAVYFDSETALDMSVAERLGCDPTKIKHAPVEVIEECKIQILTLLNKLIDIGAKNQIMMAIDSLGNLNAAKEFADVEKDKSAGDMGLRAKSLTSLMRMITYRAAKAGVPVICANHIYENPGEMHPSKIKKQTGGLKPLYIASILVQLSMTTNKVKDDPNAPKSAMSEWASGIQLKAMTAKNRFIPPFISVEGLEINFRTGLNKYLGLLDLAIKYDIIQQRGSVYDLGDKKLGYASTFEDSAEFWENGPLQLLDECMQKDLTYSNEKYKTLEAEVEELEKELNEEPTLETA